MSTLDISFEILTPSGWVELEDPANGYSLHRDSFNQRTVQHRSLMASNDWVAGAYAARSVRDNVVEDVAFYVNGETTYECMSRVDLVLSAFDSLTYQARLRRNDHRETWTCTPADYTLESDQPLIFATMVLVKAKIPRHPTKAVEQVVLP